MILIGMPMTLYSSLLCCWKYQDYIYDIVVEMLVVRIDERREERSLQEEIWGQHLRDDCKSCKGSGDIMFFMPLHAMTHDMDAVLFLGLFTHCVIC